MVANKDIKEAHRPGSSDTDSQAYAEENYDLLEGDEYLPVDRLDKEDVEWLLDNAPEYNAYHIGMESLVLFTKRNNHIREAPTLDAYGPNEDNDSFVLCNFEEAPQGEEYTELLKLARKFTPSGRKLAFAPGTYFFAATGTHLIQVNQLKRTDSLSDDTCKKTDLPTDDKGCVPMTVVPLDFELIVGNGDEKKTIRVNRAIVFCCFPQLQNMVGDAFTDTKLELPDLDPRAVHLVLEAFTARKKVGIPSSNDEYEAFQKVQHVFGKSSMEMAKQEQEPPPAKKPKKLEHPAMADHRWLDTTFLVGPQREEIKANRAVLGSMNPVLQRILFGTGSILVDPSKPIEWPDFEVEAARQVFSALVHCGKKEFVVPLESVESAKRLMDYLMETNEGLMLKYETPFRREQTSIFRLCHGRYCDGLVLRKKHESDYFIWQY